MKKIKRFAASVLAAAMLAAFAGCGDQSWSYRTSDVSLTAGDYIYNLLNAYYEAYDMVESPDEAKKILEEEVTDSDGVTKTVEQYAIDGADQTTLKMLAVETLFGNYGLELAEDDYNVSLTYADQIWGSIKDSFEDYGISQDSFSYCYAEYGVKYGQVFEKLYGSDGDKAVSDGEMIEYFKNKYTGYAYFSISAAITDEEGNTTARSDEEIAQIESDFDSYADMINKDSKSYEEAVKKYMKDYDHPTDPTLSGAVDLDETTMTEVVVNALKELDEGKAKVVKYGEGETALYYFVYKPVTDSIIDFTDDAQSDEDTASDSAEDTSDTEENTDAQENTDTEESSDSDSDSLLYVYPLKSGYTHYSLLNEMKGEDYDKYLEEYANSLSVEKNETIIKKFKPKMFAD